MTPKCHPEVLPKASPKVVFGECVGGRGGAPAIATTSSDPGSETATGDGNDAVAGGGTVVAVGIAIFLLGACAGALVTWKKQGGRTQPPRPAGVENAMYGKPDGFGFGPVQDGSGYIEVESKSGPGAK